jgi:hypothetical protein
MQQIIKDLQSKANQLQSKRQITPLPNKKCMTAYVPYTGIVQSCMDKHPLPQVIVGRDARNVFPGWHSQSSFPPWTL